MLLLVVLLLAIPIFSVACATEEPSTPTTPSTPSQPATPPAQKPVELSLASMHAPTSPSGQQLEEWAEKIKADSNGMLTIRHYGSSTLIPGPDMRTGIREGVADIGNSFIYKAEPGFEVGVNLTQLIRGLDELDGVRIFDAIWNEYPDLMESQWQDYKMLWIIPTHATIIYTTNKPVHTIADMKGLELRVPNALLADFMKNLGATPISMSTPDWITSLDKGTTDGGATTVGSMYDFKIAEKFKYATKFAMGCSVNFLIMNKDSWNKLSPEMQKVIDDSLKSARQDAIDTWTESEALTLAFSKEKGIEFIDLSNDEYQKWNQAVRPVYDKMAEEMNAAGYPGTELVDYALGLAR